MTNELQTALIEAVRAAMCVLPDELENREMAGDMPDYVNPVREAIEKCEAALAMVEARAGARSTKRKKEVR